MNLARPLAYRAAELVRVLALKSNPDGRPGYWVHPGWSRRHPKAEAIRQAVRWPRTEFVEAVTEAESRGWITRYEDRSGCEVLGIAQLSVGLFNLADPGRRDAPDPARLDGMPHAELVASLSTFRCSSPSVERVAAALGWTVEATWEECERAARAGIVEEWPDHPASPAVGLSAYAAGRLGLHLSDDGSTLLAAGEPDRSMALESSRFRCEADVNDDPAWDMIDGTVDPTSPDGPAWAEANERARLALSKLDSAWEVKEIARRVRDGKAWGVTAEEARQDVRDDARGKLPRVATVLGLRITWPVMAGEGDDAHWWTPHDGPCPACGGESMDVGTCCVVCDALGLDQVFERIGHHPEADAMTLLGYPASAPEVGLDAGARCRKVG